MNINLSLAITAINTDEQTYYMHKILVDLIPIFYIYALHPLYMSGKQRSSISDEAKRGD